MALCNLFSSENQVKLREKKSLLRLSMTRTLENVASLMMAPSNSVFVVVAAAAADGGGGGDGGDDGDGGDGRGDGGDGGVNLPKP
ncbi:hypothetical protein Pmani_037401 [Petrolisthes manimaculis]|uniref:Uncharacterized protein n=1 Tax=Petrolisthes manimaculis TaxID=1843537 RepID=A0AAE1NGF2_9EUCA|nr:hypothetical protein Pmani_037401 [Petrolisthes manimaculis]